MANYLPEQFYINWDEPEDMLMVQEKMPVMDTFTMETTTFTENIKRSALRDVYVRSLQIEEFTIQYLKRLIKYMSFAINKKIRFMESDKDFKIEEVYMIPSKSPDFEYGYRFFMQIQGGETHQSGMLEYNPDKKIMNHHRKHCFLQILKNMIYEEEHKNQEIQPEREEKNKDLQEKIPNLFELVEWDND